MTHHPFDPTELARRDPERERTAEHLERYAAATDSPPALDLVARISAAVDEEPDPSGGWWTSLTAGLVAWRRPALMLAAAAVVVAVAVGAVALGDLFERVRNVGSSPEPSVIVSPSPSATPTPSPSPSPTPTPSASPSGEPSSSPTPPTGAPTVSPSDDDDFETPEPSDDPDTSDDSSGPGGGDD